jgi:ankyrin repeat protein
MSNPLIDAIDSGDLDRVAKLLAAGVDPNATIPRYFTPLQNAVCEYEPPDYLGGVDSIVLLLRHGALVDKREGAEDETPLLLAVKRNHIEAVRILLAAGADPNVRDNVGDSPLRWCAEHGHLEMARLLLLCGATKTIRESGGPTGMNALGFAATRLHVDMVRLLLAHGADPRIEDVDDMTTFRRLRLSVESGRIPDDPVSQARLQEIRQLLGDPSV